MKKRALSLILCIIICISLSPTAASAVTTRDTSFEESLAVRLKGLGLFKGISDNDFDLDREPSRLEALIMLIRVLGKEQEALNGSWKHPFADVPGWADKYVGYAYEKGLTKGISNTEFGTDAATSYMYLTFILRALGYSDINGTDFTWDNPYTLAKKVGILPNCVNNTKFLRADVVIVSYAALPVELKGGAQTLAQKLIAAGVFTDTQYSAYYDANAVSDHENAFPEIKTELTAEQIYAKCSPAVFYIEVYNAKGVAVTSGSGFFIESNGVAVTNYHVIKDAVSAKITVSDTQKTYGVLGVYDYSDSEDWAVIKVDGKDFATLQIGDDSTIVGGATVYAIGSPLGLQNSISQGLISNTKRVENGVSYIQTSAAISSGSSGGALINKYGEVIGVTSATYIGGQNLNLALPVSVFRNFSTSKLHSLSDLASSTKNETLNGSRQQNAYSILRSWILQNYNVMLGNERDKTYEETIRAGNSVQAYQVVYNSGGDEIYLRCVLTSGSVEAHSIITLKPSGYYYPASFFYYNSPTDTDYSFNGFGNIYAPSFNEDTDYRFSSYEGNPAAVASCQTLAKYMYLDSLNFADYIFCNYMTDYGYYGTADFGFTDY